MKPSDVMTFQVKANRVDAELSRVKAKEFEFVVDTSQAGRIDALNPVELLLASLSACLIKGVQRVAGTLGIDYDSITVSLTAHRPVDEARIEDIDYLVSLGTTASQAKLDMVHKNLMKFGTIYNTVKSGTRLSGRVVAG